MESDENLFVSRQQYQQKLRAAFVEKLPRRSCPRDPPGNVPCDKSSVVPCFSFNLPRVKSWKARFNKNGESWRRKWQFNGYLRPPVNFPNLFRCVELGFEAQISNPIIKLPPWNFIFSALEKRKKKRGRWQFSEEINEDCVSYMWSGNWGANYPQVDYVCIRAPCCLFSFRWLDQSKAYLSCNTYILREWVVFAVGPRSYLII